MEEKQLDFNQPLLSVRRFSPKVASETDNKRKTSNSPVRLPPLPAYKSDLKSGPLSLPGTVPFIWEKTPGRPKNEDKLPTLGVEQPPLTPNLPPGRDLKIKQQNSDQVLKGGRMSKSATKPKILKEVMLEKGSSDSDAGDEAYQDALDTLSMTESFFMYCSVSDLSGLDDQEIQPLGSFSRDQQAHNFMIGRFLPAAKAIASESPQYTSRKSLAAQEEPQQVKEVVSRQRYSAHRQIVLSHYVQDIGREESENKDDNENESENYATKVCGLFPRLCFLNPLPELRMEDRVLSSGTHGMQTKSSTSYSGTRKEHARTAYREKKSLDSRFGSREEKTKNVMDPHRIGCNKFSACENTQCDFGCASPVVEKTLYVDSLHKVKSHSSSSSSAMKSQTNHRWDRIETSTRDSENCEKPSIEPKISESLDFPFVSCPDRSSNDMQMDITNHHHTNKIVPEKQRFTKPLEHKIDLDQNSVISSPKVAQCKKTLSKNLVTSNQEKFDGSIQNLGSQRSSRLACDVEVDLRSLLATLSTDQECSKGDSDGKIDLEMACDVEVDLRSLLATHSTDQECSKGDSDGKIDLEMACDVEVDLRSLLAAHSTDQECSEGDSDGKIDLENQCLKRSGNQEKSDAIHFRLPFALPSPKAPSESWLKRTLPTVSSRNISLWPSVAARIPARTRTPNTATPDLKWETIVKSSEELLAPIPED